MTTGPLADADLTRGAQSGDVVALGLLLERHRAGMRAVALSLLGRSPDVDDAVQDAALTALRRIGDVRDPAAVGPWLRMIVRNACRDRLRSVTPAEPVDDLALPSAGPTPEQALDRHALRDWVWDAIEELSPALRLPLVLRHFSTDITSYEQIAAVCALPVGTVRSRLSQGRAKLAEALTATAASAHGDAARLTAASRREAHETLAAAERGEFAEVLADRWAPDVALLSGNQPVGGGDLLIRGMEGDLAAGVRQHLAHVVASRSLAIWEMDMTSPAEDPEHCPPAVTWLMTLEQGRVHRLRLFHPRPAGTAPAGAGSAAAAEQQAGGTTAEPGRM
ncbi:RNA polymerase sigma-70 factor, ECF subfamily [Streptomyces sp. DvalAA-14]|uniref:RNA polymerase sigma factor n=1 Tax=unclassified Streptomyces TaxID=2593676 RepID=UPI00081B5FAD|nr:MULTISPECIES: sigma-70 family RNA polymerase sigma factor [unclassified Streptomyces]MYS23041.1 sigma-70 family RNA polymerase sigma factor [Streptomyces sp. SID4948]SCE26468.1 RNA polymerase sigma-70 factor, ECF subfamily [Streptomyces sp. DvalAA-14]